MSINQKPAPSMLNCYWYDTFKPLNMIYNTHVSLNVYYMIIQLTVTLWMELII